MRPRLIIGGAAAQDRQQKGWRAALAAGVFCVAILEVKAEEHLKGNR